MLLFAIPRDSPSLISGECGLCNTRGSVTRHQQTEKPCVGHGIAEIPHDCGCCVAVVYSLCRLIAASMCRSPDEVAETGSKHNWKQIPLAAMGPDGSPVTNPNFMADVKAAFPNAMSRIVIVRTPFCFCPGTNLLANAALLSCLYTAPPPGLPMLHC